MEIYYKSARFIDGKVRWVIIDKNNNIIRDPSEEQKRVAISQDSETYKNSKYNERKCFICGKDLSKVFSHNYYNKDGKWDRKSRLCNSCYLENRYSKISQYRNGTVDKYGGIGKAIIGQWTVAKTLGIKDLNIENRNFHEHIDLSDHCTYGKPDAKTSKFDDKNGFWSIPIDNDRFDTAIILCFDSKRENIDRAYAIPCEAIGDRKSISIVKNPSKGEQWYEEFRIDEKPYNDLYHSVDIPRFFNPFDLWSGEYNDAKNGDEYDGASVE